MMWKQRDERDKSEIVCNKAVQPCKAMYQSQAHKFTHLSISDADVNGLADGSGHSSAKQN